MPNHVLGVGGASPRPQASGPGLGTAPLSGWSASAACG